MLFRRVFPLFTALFLISPAAAEELDLSLSFQELIASGVARSSATLPTGVSPPASPVLGEKISKRKKIVQKSRSRPLKMARGISFQGVFKNRKGKLSAIINGKIRDGGDWFRVKGLDGSVRVRKIAAQWILLEHAGKLFRKRLD